MDGSNPYAPPQSAVEDIVDPSAGPIPADRGTRLAAAILDGIILMGMVYLPILFAAAIVGAFGGMQGTVPEASIIAAVALLVAIAGFAAWCWLNFLYVMRNGQSIAKKILGIKVVRSDGSPASLARIFWLRNVVNWFVSIIPLYFVIDGLFIFGESRQCVHDKIADTIVIRA